MNEIYRLTLEHYIDDEGKKQMIEEPLVFQMVQRSDIPVPVCLNHMLEMMKREVLRMENEL